MTNDNRIQVNATSAYEQTSRTRENERTRLNQLLGGPGLIDPAERFDDSDDEGLRPEDNLELLGSQPVQAPPVVQPPQVGAAVPVDQNEDIVIPVTGRGGAVALQDYLKGLLDQGERQRFDAAAQALGVEDKADFEDAVQHGTPLAVFGQVDSNRVVFTDSNFNEVSADQLSAVAKAQLVIKPSYEVPIDPEVKTPEVVNLDPNLRQQKSQELPSDPEEQIQRDLVTPDQPRPDQPVVTA